MNVSLKTIAQEAGVSIGTVSRVMRGDDAFAAETIEKVQRIANEMGYRPNRLVASIQAGKTQTIGVMVPPEGMFFGRVLAGIHAKLAHNDYIPLHLWATPELPEREQIHRLLDRRVDGMILFASDHTAPDPFIEEVWRRNIPAVSVDRLIEGSPADFVGTDDKLGGELAAKHLLDLGHRNVMHLAARPDISTSHGRWQGFKKIIGARRGAQTAYAVAEDFYSGYELAMEFLSQPDRPTAVFAGNDYLAVDTLRAARDLGIDVPTQLSVVGFSDLPIAENSVPPLTTLRQEPDLIGQAAAQVVLDRIYGKLKSKSPHIITLQPTLIDRESTGPVPI